MNTTVASSTHQFANRENARLLAWCSCFCWAGGLVVLLVLGALGFFFSALFGFSGLATAASALNYARLARDSVTLFIMLASVPFVSGVSYLWWVAFHIFGLARSM